VLIVRLKVTAASGGESSICREKDIYIRSLTGLSKKWIFWFQTLNLSADNRLLTGFLDSPDQGESVAQVTRRLLE
jgi:hypothetical protein